MTMFLLFVVLLLPNAQDAEDATGTFDTATSLLGEGRYEEALAQYKSVQSMGLSSAALWHNMGIAYYRLNHLGHAILYFERAARVDPEHEAIQHSLRVARERQVDSFSSLPRPFWRTMQTAVLDAVSTRAWFILGLVFIYGAMTLYLAQVFDRIRIPLGRSIHVILPVVGGICVLVALSSSMWPPRPETAVIVASEATLVEQADPAAPPVRVVHEGLTVQVRTQTPEWVLVQLSNGTRGWVPAETLESI